MKVFVLFIVFVLSLISCTKIIEIDIPHQDPKPVVNCLFQKDSTFKIQLNKSAGILDDYAEPITNAKVVLYKDNTEIEILVFNGKEFESQVVAQANQNYSFKAYIPTLGEVSAVDSVPNTPVFGECVIIDKIIVLDEEIQYTQEIQINIQDTNSAKNYYELLCLKKYVDPNTNKEITNSFYYHSTSPIIENEGILYPESLVFSDELFNNQNGTIKINYRKPQYWIPGDYNDSHDIDNYSIIVVLRSITNDYYTYKKKLYQHLYAQESDSWYGVGEPTQMYSNIQRGYGIFAGYSEVRQEVFPEE